MRNLLIPLAVYCSIISISCDKINNPIPIEEGAIDWTLYPGGDPATYPYPIWTSNNNTDRNVLIEDYTGHLCTNCPAAAEDSQLFGRKIMLEEFLLLQFMQVQMGSFKE